jgi:hypothetical protein
MPPLSHPAQIKIAYTNNEPTVADHRANANELACATFYRRSERHH